MCHCFSGCSVRGGKRTLLVWVQGTRAEKGFPCERLKYLLLPHRSVFLFVHFYELPMRPVLSSLYLSQNRESLAYCEVVKWKSLSCVRLFETPWTIQCTEFSRPEYWSGYPFPSPGDLPNPGIKPRSSTLQAYSLPAEPPGKNEIREGANWSYNDR